MDMKLHLLESFFARGSDGRDYKVCGYERLVRDPSLPSAEAQWEPTGMAEYRLDSGDLIDARPDGSLRLARSGVQLERLH
jgi:hypothetical protein